MQQFMAHVKKSDKDKEDNLRVKTSYNNFFIFFYFFLFYFYFFYFFFDFFLRCWSKF